MPRGRSKSPAAGQKAKKKEAAALPRVFSRTASTLEQGIADTATALAPLHSKLKTLAPARVSASYEPNTAPLAVRAAACCAGECCGGALIALLAALLCATLLLPVR